MKISILTLFPESFDSFRKMPVTARAVEKGAVDLDIIDLKDYAPGSFRHLDDSPFGGGAGMVMRCQPVLDALKDVSGRSGTSPHVVALTPAGTPYRQQDAHRLAGVEHLVLICGHYEGMDERIFTAVDEELSLGDFILTGGEPAAQCIADSIIRLLPGALREASTKEESFEDGLLEYPQYTQPREYEGMTVPDVLLSGDHGAVDRWRRKEALKRTKERRPDLYEQYIADGKLSEEDRLLLEEDGKS